MDPQTPPASPGLVLEGRAVATNAGIDEFALDAPSVTGTGEGRETRDVRGNVSKGRLRRRLEMALEEENSGAEGTTGATSSSRGNSVPPLAEEPLTLLTVSSDSYFSHHRDSFNEGFGTPVSVKTRRRRTSDQSDSGSIASVASVRSLRSQSDSDSEYERGPRQRRLGGPMLSLEEESDGSTTGSRPSSRPGSRHDSATGSRSGSRSGSRTRTRSASTNRLMGKDYAQPTAIFKSLFILEQSLCEQYIQQTNLRYGYLLFLFALSTALVGGLWASFWADIPDQLRMLARCASTILLVTLTLFYSSGMYHRTISRPRQFLVYTNRGLRQFNVKLVRVRASIYVRLVKAGKAIWYGAVATAGGVVGVRRRWLKVLPHAVMTSLARYEATLRYERRRDAIREVKVMLNPRAFNGSTRDQWEVYRRQQGLLERARRGRR